MAHNTDYVAFVIPTGHTIVDDVSGSGGSPLDAAHLNPLRDDPVIYLQHHVAGDQAFNNHATSAIWEVGGGTTVGETTAYANVAATDYSQATINAMLRWVLRLMLGGTTTSASLTALITTWFARSDVANVNLFSLATLFGTATPNDTVATVPLRGATDGEVNFRAILSTLPNSSGQLANFTFTRSSGQTKPFWIARDESLVTLSQLTAAGLLQAVQSLIIASNAGLVASKVQAAPSPSVDIWQITDSAGVPLARMNTSLFPVFKNGIYTGAVGSEVQIANTNSLLAPLQTPRQHLEFVLTPSPSALTIASTGGKIVDSVGARQLIAASATAFTVTSHATLYVWWALSYSNGGAPVATANVAGGNATAGSAVQGNFPQVNTPIGYIRVPPAVTNLSAAIMDDWRNTKVGDGNDGAGGGMAITTSAITDLDETGAYANTKQISKVLMGGATVAAPTGSGLSAAGGPSIIRSGYTSNVNYDNSLADRLQNDVSPGLAASISMSGTMTATMAASANAPQWISVAGRWRSISSPITALAVGTGIRYLIADLSASGPGFTMAWASSASLGSFQKLLAQGYSNGTTIAPLDTSPIQKMGYMQYAPFITTANANPSGNSPSAITSVAGGATLTLNNGGITSGFIVWLVNWTGAVTGVTRYQLLFNPNGAGYSALLPYTDVTHTGASTEASGTAQAVVPVILAAGQTTFVVNGTVVSGTGVTPVNAFMCAYLFGAQ